MRRAKNTQREDSAAISVTTSFGLAAVSTACCALPAALVVLGAGGAVASLVSAAPWLVTLSRYKLLVFALTALALLYARTRLHRAQACEVADARRLRRQRRVLVIAALLLGASVFVAFVLPPLVNWWEAP